MKDVNQLVALMFELFRSDGCSIAPYYNGSMITFMVRQLNYSQVQKVVDTNQVNLISSTDDGLVSIRFVVPSKTED